MLGTAGDRPEHPALVEVDANVEGVLEAQRQRRLRAARIQVGLPAQTWWIAW